MPRKLGRTACAAAAFAAIAPALAQSGAWLLEHPIDGPGGNGVVEPGEPSLLSIALDYRPGPEEPFDGGTIVGFYDLLADLRGVSNWSSGYVTWTVNPDLIFLTGDLTRKDDATQDLVGISAVQIPGFGPFSTADPLHILTVRWETADFTPRDVAVRLDTSDDFFRVHFRRGITMQPPLDWPLPDADWSFRVVPAPGAALVFAAPLLASRRRPRAPAAARATVST